MKKSYLIIIAVILIIIAGLIGFKLGFVSGKKSLEATVNQYKKVIDYYFPSRDEVFSVSGKITEVKDNVLGVEVIMQDPYVLPNEWKTEIVKALITDKTEIMKFDINTGKETKIKLNDLKIGDEISARASENIKDKSEFEAQYINLTVFPEAPEAPEM